MESEVNYGSLNESVTVSSITVLSLASMGVWREVFWLQTLVLFITGCKADSKQWWLLFCIWGLFISGM